MIASKMSPEGSASSISPADNTAAAISLESRGDGTKVIYYLVPTNNISKDIAENGSNRTLP